MRKIVINKKTGAVENIIEADNTFKIAGKTLLTDTGKAKIGDIYDGVNFTSPPLTALEKQTLISDMRKQRDMLLQQSDFAMLTDSPLTSLQITAYKTYRKELRNLPVLFPTGVNVVYPTKPK